MDYNTQRTTYCSLANWWGDGCDIMNRAHVITNQSMYCTYRQGCEFATLADADADADPDPSFHQSYANPQPLFYRPSRAPFWASRIHWASIFEPLKPLNFDFIADPDPAFHSMRTWIHFSKKCGSGSRSVTLPMDTKLPNKEKLREIGWGRGLQFIVQSA
jgi:hypothetical protein